jgi:hypothetical protein
MDCGGDEAEAGKHPPPIHSGGVCKDGSEACLSVTPPKAYCARDGVARETKPELAFSRYEVYEEKTWVYRPKGLLAYTTTAKEHVKLFYFLPFIFASKSRLVAWHRLGGWGFWLGWLRWLE